MVGVNVFETCFRGSVPDRDVVVPTIKNGIIPDFRMTVSQKVVCAGWMGFVSGDRQTVVGGILGKTAGLAGVKGRFEAGPLFGKKGGFGEEFIFL